MYSYRKLPASNSLEGVFDFGYGWSWFSQYWNALKGNINELYALGPKIATYFQKISVVQQKLLAQGNTQLAEAMGDELKKIADDMQKWSKVKEYLDTWVPKFVLAEKEYVSPTGQALGALPLIVFGVAGIAALAFLVNSGLALLQDYAYKTQLTQAVIEQKITTGQMTEILSVPREEGVFEKVVSNVGIGAAIGIPTVLLVGGGLYIALQMGLLSSLLKTVGLGGSSSTQSSGG